MMKLKDNKGKNSVTLVLFIACFALFLRIFIEQIIKGNIVQNESSAADTVKLISAALENYAKDNLGAFPTNLSALAQTSPPYLNKNYVSKAPIKGYNFGCQRLEAGGYSCSAVPVRCNLTGNLIYKITTGGIFVSEKCSKKE